MAEWMRMEVPSWFLIVIAVGVVFYASRKPSRATSRPRADGKSEKKVELVTEASTAAQDVARRLGVAAGSGKRRVPVTVCVNNVIFMHKGSEWSSIPDAVRVAALLNEVASVFLIAWVDSDQEEKVVKDLALSKGLVVPSRAGNRRDVGIPQHRLLFCSSLVGQIALVRQLRVSLHVGGSVALLEGISRFVPALIRIDSDAVEPSNELLESPLGRRELCSANGSSRGMDSIGWREFKSLTTAAGLRAAVPDDLPMLGSAVANETNEAK